MQELCSEQLLSLAVSVITWTYHAWVLASPHFPQSQVAAMSRTLSMASYAALAASDALASTAAAYDLAFRPMQSPVQQPSRSPAVKGLRTGQQQVPVVALRQRATVPGQEAEQEDARSPEELQQDRLARILQVDAGLPPQPRQNHRARGILPGCIVESWLKLLADCTSVDV